MKPGPEIAGLKAPGNVAGVYLLLRCQEGTTKNGKPYGALALGDKSGQIEARIWDNAPELLAGRVPGDLVEVAARLEEYRGQPQMVIQDLRPAPEDMDPALFLPASPMDPEELWAELSRLRRGVVNPFLKQLLSKLFNGKELARAFRNAPAAKGFHHAYVHGLLEHTVSVAGLARMTAAHYGYLDADVLITGAILHDIGKTRELTLGPPIDYTVEGRLLGHLVLGLEIIKPAMAGIKGFPVELNQHIQHLIVSHHGQRDFGSPEVPKTPESLVLHQLDDLDAKTAGLKQFLESNQAGPDGFSPWHRGLERQFYCGFNGGEPENAAPCKAPEPDPATPSLFGEG